MHQKHFKLTGVFLLAFTFALGGCIGLGGKTPTTKFYVLNSLHTSEINTQPVANLKEITIGVGPLKLTQVLDRPQIITRSSRNEIQVSDFDRWAEPLQDNLSRVIADNLSVLLETDRIIIFPWRTTIPVTYQVAMNIIRLDGEPGAEVVLRARWAVLAENGKKVLLEKQSVLDGSTAGSSVAAMVSAQSRLVAELSREIAEGVKTLEDQRAGQ
jgi:uncharacterized lipoprotein YmbA